MDPLDFLADDYYRERTDNQILAELDSYPPAHRLIHEVAERLRNAAEPEETEKRFTPGASFGEFAREKRTAAGLSQDTCAKALGLVNRSSFCRLERGETGWSLINIVYLAGLFGLTAGQLLSEYERRVSVG